MHEKQYLGQEDPLEDGMATHSSILPRKIPWTEEPGGLQFIGKQSQTQPSTQAQKINWDSKKEFKTPTASCFKEKLCQLFPIYVIHVYFMNI